MKTAIEKLHTRIDYLSTIGEDWTGPGKCFAPNEAAMDKAKDIVTYIIENYYNKVIYGIMDIYINPAVIGGIGIDLYITKREHDLSDITISIFNNQTEDYKDNIQWIDHEQYYHEVTGDIDTIKKTIDKIL